MSLIIIFTGAPCSDARAKSGYPLWQISSAPAASCWAPPPPAVTKLSSILSCLSQPSSVAMYCGHCAGPCATIPAVILVCASAAPADSVDATGKANSKASTPRKCRPCETGNITISIHLRLRCSRNLTQASKIANTDLYIFLGIIAAPLSRAETADEIRNNDCAASHHPAGTAHGSRRGGDQVMREPRGPQRRVFRVRVRRRPPRRRARLRHHVDRRALPRPRSFRLGARLRACHGHQAN